MKKIRLKVEGMSCSACSVGLYKYLSKQKGIDDAFVNLVLQEVVICYEDFLKVADLERFISEAGFKSLGEAKNFDVVKNNKKQLVNVISLGVISLLIIYLSMGKMIGLPVILSSTKDFCQYFLGLLLLASGGLILGRDILKSGFNNFIHKTFNMDTLVSLGVLFSFLYSLVLGILVCFGKDIKDTHLYFESVVMVLFFVKLGRYIERNNKNKMVDAISDLVQITPKQALMIKDEMELAVTIDEINVDDFLVAKPGMRIAVDGIIIKGTSHFDESFFTGESMFVKKSVGDTVIAGSMNYDGVVYYQAKKIGRNSTISEIVHLITDAINTKMKLSRIVDKVSGIFVPVILSIALVTFIGYLLLSYSLAEALIALVNVLVVACPCALGLATPLAIIVSMGFCAKNGILVKSSEILENVPKVDVVVFDKTGILTYGDLQIANVITTNYSEEELFRIVASIEKNSTHPIGRPFLNYVDLKKISLLESSNFKNLAGIGVTAQVGDHTYYLGDAKLFSKLKIENPYQKEEYEFRLLGNSIVYVIEDKKAIGLIGVMDIVRKESRYVIDKLLKMNKRVIMLTGDNLEVASRVANEIGILEVIAEVMPKEKQELISKLKQDGKMVMMVGDGINDSPSLVTADIGVSISSALDIAVNSADVILMKNNLTSILDLVIISNKTIKNIYGNLFLAYFYNICMIPIAIGLFRPIGLVISPMIASLAMVLSSLMVVLNALRLKKIKLERKV